MENLFRKSHTGINGITDLVCEFHGLSAVVEKRVIWRRSGRDGECGDVGTRLISRVESGREKVSTFHGYRPEARRVCGKSACTGGTCTRGRISVASWPVPQPFYDGSACAT